MKKINLQKSFLMLIVGCALLFKYWSIWGLINDSFKYIFFGLSIIFSIMNIMIKKFSRKEWIKILLFLFLSMIICYSTGEIDFIYSFLLAIIFMKEKNGDYIFVKYYTVSALCLFIITIIFGKLGITDTFRTVRLVNGVLTQRNSLGFEHVNAVFKNFFPICLGFYMLFFNKEKKQKIFLYIIMIVTGYLLYKQTNSRTGYYAILMIVPLDYVFHKIKNKYSFGITKYFFLIFTVFTIVITFVYGTTHNSINTLLSDRPILYYKVLTQSNITLLGDMNKGIVDNTYIWLMYNKGLIVYVTYLCVYMIASKKLLKNKIFVLPFLLFCMYSTLENLDVYNYNFLMIIELMVIMKNSNVNFKWIQNSEIEREKI